MDLVWKLVSVVTLEADFNNFIFLHFIKAQKAESNHNFYGHNCNFKKIVWWQINPIFKETLMIILIAHYHICYTFNLAVFIYIVCVFQDLALMQDSDITRCPGYPGAVSEVSQYTVWFNRTLLFLHQSKVLRQSEAEIFRIGLQGVSSLLAPLQCSFKIMWLAS